MPSWKKVIVSGSDASLNSINVATNVVAQSFTGSLFGTASFAVSSSHAIFADSSSQATSASFATTASYAGFALSASRATTSSYALYAETASYAINITVSGSISDVDYINFDTNIGYTLAEGRLGWDSGEGTLQLGMEGGNVQYSLGEQILQYCFNAETSSLSKGQVVFISGSQGNRIAVKLADNSADRASAGTLGFVAETITAGGNGWVITEGNLRKLNTVGLTPGALLYLGSTPGTYTETKPIAPRHEVRVGYVERVHATVGSIYVKVDNGYEIGELHDVVDNTTTASYGDLLVKSGSVWINSKQLTGSYELTGSLTANQVYVTALTASHLQVINNGSIAGSLSVTNAITASVARSNVFINNQSITENVHVPSGSNALIVGPVNIEEEIVVEEGGILYITDFSPQVSASYAENAATASFALTAANAPGFTTNHTQLTASTTWSFSHNLNTRNPLVQVYDLNYNQILPNEIVGIDAFNIEIRFDYTQAGYAVASNGGGLYVTGSTPRLVQTVAATTWSFAHSLGTKYPGFEVFNSNDDVIIPAGIHVVDINNAEIYFATPTTGTVIANFSGIDGSLDNAISASYAATASYSDQFNIGQTQTQYATVTSSINGSNTVFNVATGSYSSAFFKYTVASGSNARSGEIMSVWNGSTVTFTDNSTTDIGTTTAVTSSVAISASNAQLTMQTNTAGWRIKSIATFI